MRSSGDGEFYRAVFENAGVAVFVHDLEGNFLEVNASCERLGYDHAELLKMNLLDIEPAGLKEKFPQWLKELRRNGHALFETSLLTRDGMAVEVELSSSLMDYEGRPAVICIARDITQHKRADEALAESEALYHRLADNIRDIIGTVDPKGTLTYMSPSVKRVLGHDPAELIGKSAFDYIHEDDRESVINTFIAERKGLEPVLAVFRRRHADGHYVWLESMDNPIADENGNSLGANFVTRDVTTRRLAEEALRESESKYHDLYENAPVAYFSVGADGRIMQCNRAAEEFTGYPRAELEGMPVFDLYAEESHARARELFQVFKGGASITGEEMAYRRKDGGIVYGLLNVSVIMDEYDKVLASRSSIVDISKRKAVEEALRESEEHYLALVDTSPDAVFLCDLQARLIMVNQRAMALFGFDEKMAMEGTSGLECFVPEERARAVENLRKLRKTELTRNTEYRMLRRDGSEFIGELSTTLVRDAKGKARNVVGVVRDVTEHKQSEKFNLAMRDLGLRLGSVSGLRNALLVCLEEAIECSGMDCGGVYLMNEADGSLELALQRGLSDRFVETVMRYEASSPNAEIVRRGICTYGKYPQLGVPLDAAQKQEGLRAIAVIPVPYEGKATACMNIASHTMEEVPPASRANLEILATQLGSVIARAGAEEALRVSEEKYRNIFERAMEGIFQSTPEGRLISVNPAFARMYGSPSPRRMIEQGDDISEYLYYNPDDRSKIAALLEDPGLVQGFETRMRRRDGTVFWASINARAVRDAGGKMIYFEGIVEDVTEKKRAKEELEVSREQLRALTARLQQAREDERSLIARELHDELGQTLTSLKIDLNWINKRITDQMPRHEAWREKISSMSQLLDENIQMVRKISTDLRPPLLDDFGLIPAMEWQAQEFQERTGIKCVFVSDLEEDLSLHREGNIALFRVVQESLTNVARHASATRVKIKLAIKGDDLTLEVTDNGVGIEDELVDDIKSLGILGMKERLHLLDGKFTIKGKRGKGTKIVVSLPLL